MNIDRPEFFQNLLEENKGLSFGHEIQSYVGQNDLFGRLDLILHSLLDIYIGDNKGVERTTAEKKIQIFMMQLYIEQLEEVVASLNPSPAALAQYRGYVEKVQHYMDLAEFDIEVREQHGKTFLYNGLLFFNDFPEAQKSRAYMEKNLPELLPHMPVLVAKERVPSRTMVLDRVGELLPSPELYQRFEKKFLREFVFAADVDDTVYVSLGSVLDPHQTVSTFGKYLAALDGDFEVGKRAMLRPGCEFTDEIGRIHCPKGGVFQIHKVVKSKGDSKW